MSILDANYKSTKREEQQGWQQILHGKQCKLEKWQKKKKNCQTRIPYPAKRSFKKQRWHKDC